MSENKTRFGIPRFEPAAVIHPAVLSSLIHKIGHDIGNPLTAIISLATIIERFSCDAGGDLEAAFKKAAGYSASIIDEAWKISALSEKMVMLLSEKPGNVSPCRMESVLTKVIQKAKTRGRRPRPEVKVMNLAGELDSVLADSEQLGILFGELIGNAQNALAYEFGDAALDLPVTVTIRGEGDRCFMTCSNDTKSAFPGELDAVFDLFQTNYTMQKHLGIGLTMCTAIARRFGGSLRAIEQPRPDGYTFTIEVAMPRSVEEEEAA